jgi:pyruvate dehydrogenase E2 component (dihydrolipoamide acetyltransferase)
MNNKAVDNAIENYRVVPLTPLRKIIAARMSEAKQMIPHFRVSADIEMDALLALRKQLNTQKPENKLSVNDYLIKACAIALMENLAINSQWVEGEIHQYQHADISVVMAVEGGLSTPVVRQANHKSVQTIAEQVKDLAARAKNGNLKMNEIMGGSFSISNLGMYGVDQFDAIINPPQCAILAVGCAKQQVLIKKGEMGIANIMRVTLSMDHRAVDGVIGAQFLSTLKDLLQYPEQLLG